MKILVSWSGGKDSQACLIYAVEKYGAANVTAVFCDTGWEHDVTYRHVKMIPEALGVNLVTLKNKKYNGMVDLSMKKGMFPSTKSRFCTEELKVKPMIDYVLSQNDNLLIFQGIRADESKSRSKMSEQCRYFKHYFEPYGNDKNGKPKYHTYRKKDILKWCEQYSDDVHRPIFEWTGQQTISYIIDHGLPVNPLYYQGAKRVGCYPCIMCTKSEIKSIIANDPDRIDIIRHAENNGCGTFFNPDYIPARYLRNSDSKGNPIAKIDDVVRYIRDKNATGDLFAEIEKEERQSSGRRCMSAYSICE